MQQAAAEGTSVDPKWKGSTAAALTFVPPGEMVSGGSALSVLFDEFVIHQGRMVGRDLVHTSAFRSEIDAGRDPVRLLLRNQIRGRIIKGPDSRVTLWVRLGPCLETRDFPYGTSVDEDGMIVEPECDFSYTPGEPYTGVIVVVVEQRASDPDLMVSVDSLDVRAGFWNA